MEHTTIAVDLAKSVFEIAVSNHPGKVAERHRLSRDAFLRFFANRQPATVLISKRGDVYIRMLLTHGARPVLLKAKSRKDPDRLRAWALRLEHSRGHNKATIALANKLARVVWAVWRRDVEFTEHAQEAA